VHHVLYRTGAFMDNKALMHLYIVDALSKKNPPVHLL